MNNKKREKWIMDDKVLFHWWQKTGLKMKDFIKEYKLPIDVAIEGAITLNNKDRCC